MKESHLLSQYSPIWGNQCFVPGRADATFKVWASKGLDSIQKLYLQDSDIMMSFEELRKKYGLLTNHLFKYLQLRNFVRVTQDNLDKPPLSVVEEIMMKDSLKKGLISENHNLLTSDSAENSDYKLNAWKENLQSEISHEEWRTACSSVHTSSINARL